MISECNCRPVVLLQENQGLPFPPGFVPQDLVHKYYKCLTLYDGLPRWLVVKNLPAMQESWLRRSCREGHGNLLQNSYLKNPMDKRAGWATVRGVARAGHEVATKPPTALCDVCGACKCLLCHYIWCLVLTPCKNNGDRITVPVDMLQMCASESFCLALYT